MRTFIHPCVFALKALFEDACVDSGHERWTRVFDVPALWVVVLCSGVRRVFVFRLWDPGDATFFPACVGLCVCLCLCVSCFTIVPC